jgi:hypothetical protein
MLLLTTIATALLLYTTTVLSQATPQQTIVPFSTLPACASKCGPLYDAQGACSPPVTPTSDVNCFCNNPKLAPIYQGGDACLGLCDQAGLDGIRSWFLGLCPNQAASAPTTTVDPGTGATAAPGSASSSTPSSGGKPAPWYVPPLPCPSHHASPVEVGSKLTNPQDQHTLPMGNNDRRPHPRHHRRLDPSLSPPPPLHPQARARIRTTPSGHPLGRRKRPSECHRRTIWGWSRCWDEGQE